MSFIQNQIGAALGGCQCLARLDGATRYLPATTSLLPPPSATRACRSRDSQPDRWLKEFYNKQKRSAKAYASCSVDTKSLDSAALAELCSRSAGSASSAEFRAPDGPGL